MLAGGPKGGRITLAEHDPALADRFEAEPARLATVFSGRIERIGSTSVPSLAAKPIVDISVAVDDPDDDAASCRRSPARLGATGHRARTSDVPHARTRRPRSSVARVRGSVEHGQLLLRDYRWASAGGPVGCTSA